MHLLRTLLPFATTPLLATARAQEFPPPWGSLFPNDPVASVVSTAVAAAPIPTGVQPAIASAVAAVPAGPNNAPTDLIPGLDIPPSELYDNILAAMAIASVVLNMLNSSGLAEVQVVDVKRDLDLPDDGIAGLLGLSAGGSLGYAITALVESIVPLFNLEA